MLLPPDIIVERKLHFNYFFFFQLVDIVLQSIFQELI